MPRLALLVIAVATALAAACGASLPRRGPTGPTLAETVDAQIAKEDAIVWAQRRPLVWADFRAEPPADAGAVAAETGYSLIHGAACTRSTFEFRVVAAFRPRDSWVRLGVLRTPLDSTRALRHEQTHFDLTEVHARRLRRYFAELMAPCRASTGDLSAMADRIGRDEKAAQAQYDAETANGRTLAQQARWEKDVASQLAALAKYAK